MQVLDGVFEELSKYCFMLRGLAICKTSLNGVSGRLQADVNNVF